MGYNITKTHLKHTSFDDPMSVDRQQRNISTPQHEISFHRVQRLHSVNMGRGMITRPTWKWPCIKLFITFFQHLEKRRPYWPETKSRPILASIWK
jgi:hypothetical protein